MKTNELGMGIAQETGGQQIICPGPERAALFLTAVKPVLHLIGEQMALAEARFTAVRDSNIVNQADLLLGDSPGLRREAAAELSEAEARVDNVRDVFDHKAQQIQEAQRVLATQPR